MKNEKARSHFYQMERRYWRAYALSCAHAAARLPEENLILVGELALQQALSCSLRLDKETSIYDEFQALVDGWDPSAKTLQLCKKGSSISLVEAPKRMK